MSGQVTTKGQVTIPKSLRERFGIRAGTRVEFRAGPEGITLRKVVDRSRRKRALGCLREELGGREVGEWLDEVRGGVEMPRARKGGGGA